MARFDRDYDRGYDEGFEPGGYGRGGYGRASMGGRDYSQVHQSYDRAGIGRDRDYGYTPARDFGRSQYDLNRGSDYPWHDRDEYRDYDRDRPRRGGRTGRGRYGPAGDYERRPYGEREVDYDRGYGEQDYDRPRDYGARGNFEPRGGSRDLDYDRMSYGAGIEGGNPGRRYTRQPYGGRGYGEERYGGAQTAPYTEPWSVPGPHTGRGPEGYERSKERIEEDVSERLTRHGQIDASKIRVKVENGEVTLEGTVDARETKRLAEDVAESVSGVRDVHNRLQIEQHQGEQADKENGQRRTNASAKRGSSSSKGASS